jgi:rhodanese-related sulfurtransferase
MKARRWKGKILALLVMAAALGAGWFFIPAGGESTTGVAHLGAAEARAWMQKHPQAVLVDVRTPEEFRGGHLEGARLVPLDQLESLAARALPDRAAPLLVYCRSGNRSNFAVNILKNQGYSNLTNLLGGISDWSARGLPVAYD